MTPMGQWGVKSYENDAAADALDAALERVHGSVYEDLMDDRNPMSFDQVQEQLASPETLTVAIAIARETFGPERAPDDWDDAERLAVAGIIVRHAEFGVPVPTEWLTRAIDWLEHEAIEWSEATVRRLRREKEVALLKKALGS